MVLNKVFVPVTGFLNGPSLLGSQTRNSPQLNHLKEGIRTKALVPDDFRIMTVSNQRVSGMAILHVPSGTDH